MVVCYWSGGGERGGSIWGGERPHRFPISGFCFLLMREIWAQQGYEQEALRVYGKTDSGEDKGFGVKIVVDIVGSGLFLLSLFSILVPFLWVSTVRDRR